MPGSLFDLSVFVSLEIKFNDLGLMRYSRSDILDLATGWNNDTLLSHLLHISLNCPDAGCEEQSKIFLDKKTALIIGLIRKSEELVLAQTWNTLFFQDFCIIRMGDREGNWHKTKSI